MYQLEGVIIYLTEKAILNRDFRLDLKFSRDDDFLICSGNLFHKLEPATQKAQSPYMISGET